MDTTRALTTRQLRAPVAVNLSSYLKGAIGGMEETVAAVIPALDRAESDEGRKLTIFCRPGQEENVRLLASSPNIVCVAENASENIRGYLIENAHRLLFCPLLVLEPIDSPIPGVTLIPDLQHEFFPQNFAPRVLRFRRMNFGPSVVRSRVVLTVSEFTKQTIVDRYGVSPDRIAVLELDAARVFQRAPTAQAEAAFREFRLPPAYFFYPANFWPHKNHANIMKALQILRQTRPDVELVFTGAATPDPGAILKMACELGLGGSVRHLGYVDQETLVPVYQHSLGLVFASQFEGCGLPILEAFHCGTPVIASRAASCPEIAGDAALLVDPLEPGEIAAAMRKLVENPVLAEDLREGGRVRAAGRSLERAICTFMGAMERAATPCLPKAPLLHGSQPARCWCGSSEAEAFSPEYVSCKKCQTLHLSNPLPDDFAKVDEFDEGFYGVNYWRSHQHELHLPQLEERARTDFSGRDVYWLSHLLRHVPLGKRVLEIGCAHGGFVALMRQAGYDAMGLEMSTTIVAFAQATFEVPMLLAPIERYPELRGSFDAIVAMDVVGYFLDPVAELQRYTQFLAPDGLLIIQTPCFRAGRSWEDLSNSRDPFLGLFHPGHVFLFNELSLRALLKQAGFTEIQVLPALFSYDHFVVASRQPIVTIEKSQYECQLADTQKGRIALALLDGAQYIKAAHDRLAALKKVTAAAEMLKAMYMPPRLLARLGRWFTK